MCALWLPSEQASTYACALWWSRRQRLDDIVQQLSAHVVTRHHSHDACQLVIGVVWMCSCGRDVGPSRKKMKCVKNHTPFVLLHQATHTAPYTKSHYQPHTCCVRKLLHRTTLPPPYDHPRTPPTHARTACAWKSVHHDPSVDRHRCSGGVVFMSAKRTRLTPWLAACALWPSRSSGFWPKQQPKTCACVRVRVEVSAVTCLRECKLRAYADATLAYALCARNGKS